MNLSSHQRSAFVSLLVGFLFCLYANAAWATPGELSVKALDIGQGDSILIQTPNRRTVLIDGGPGVSVLERLGEETSFWFDRIDLMVLSHPHLDHLEGLLEVVDRYQVEKLLFTAAVYHSAVYDLFLEKVAEAGVEVFIADAKQDWQIDEDLYLDVLGPPEANHLKEYENVNNASVVMRLIAGDRKLMLSGDAEIEEEHELLLTDYDLRAELMKSGHHGSRTSSSLPYLRAVRPTQVMISSGFENPFNHPHLNTITAYDEREITWWDTKDEGTLQFVKEDGGWRKQ